MMRLSTHKASVALLVGFGLLLVSTKSASGQVQRQLPNPVINFIGQEPFKTSGKQFTRYIYEVYTRDDYPKALFVASPDLPPCGTNANSSRTWIDLFDQSGKRLNGFCAIGDPKDLKSIWFALDADVVPPSWIYIEMNDRKTSTKYKSNLAETTN